MINSSLTERPLLKALISLTLPSIGSGMFIVVFEVADMFWIGRLGAEAVAALGSASFFVWMLRALAQTVATGILAMVSRRAGEGDQNRAVQTVLDGLAGTGVFTVCIMMLCLPLSHRIFLWLGLAPSVAQMAGDYVRIMILGMAAMYFSISLEHVIRGLGNTRTPMIVIGLSLMINVILDPVFIFVMDMGLEGAALATVTAHVISSVWLFTKIPHFLPAFRKCRLHHSKHFIRRTFIPMIRIGAPIAFNGVAFAAIYLVLSGIISRFGSEPLAALGIGHRIETFPFFIAWGFSVAVSSMVGQNLGARKPERARDAVILSVKIASGILFVTSLIFYFFPEMLYRFFISDPNVIAHGIRYLQWIAVFETFLASEIILEGAFSGAGYTKPMIWVAIPLTFLRIPGSWLLGIVFGLGIETVWFFISFTTFLKGVVLFAVFLKGDWVKQKV
ncbi:MATE family efflux transporter [bacterium]|nr:MATE family efflux transporter [bacterium]